jgi:iron(III) transport system permease protein
LKQRLNIFHLFAYGLVLFFALLFLNLIIYSFGAPSSIWPTIQRILMPMMMRQTIILMILSGLFAGIIGLFFAYIMSFYHFRGKFYFEILLIIPLALPTYVYGYLYAEMTSVTGSFYVFFDTLGMNPVQLAMMNMRGAIFLFALSLYPYVYLASRAFLSRQPQSILVAARSLGMGAWQRFFKVFLPLLKPTLIGSIVLVMMEVLNDYGLAQYFGLQVVSTTLFNVWFNGNDIVSAIRIALFVVGAIFALLWLESILRKHPKYAYASTQFKPIKKELPSFWIKFSFYILLSLVAFFSVFLPLFQTLRWTFLSIQLGVTFDFIIPFLHTMMMAGLAVIFIMIFSFAVANIIRFFPEKKTFMLARFASLGYSIPGVIVAISVFLVVLPFERWLRSFISLPFGPLTSSLMILVIGLTIRYLAIGIQFVNNAYQKIGTKYTLSSYALGKNHLKTLFFIDIPMIRQSLVAGILIVFIDVVKELPLTLFLRPFDFQTIATQLFRYASDERLVESGPLILILWLCAGMAVVGASQLMKQRNQDELTY